MKRFFIIMMIFTLPLTAQVFEVEKVRGDVKVLEASEETWAPVKPGMKLKGADIIVTGENSSVYLKSGASGFVLEDNSALGINNIKKMTLNELLLALAADEIKNIRPAKSDGKTRNTAVYGEKIDNRKPETGTDESVLLGLKKINGAKQLVKNGYKESAILLAKETYRKYPATRERIDDRLYFVEMMIDMNLLNEAAEEINDIAKYKIDSGNLSRLEKISRLLKEKMADVSQ
ncbi:hypothetical protein ACSSWA_07995 [Melioribacter sp. Ez-97]|uniref:hypothetical protein n=1 Tax=Melioribacter sp. Ez-97 TaxID=3423434 RepID=UPI003EDAAC54